MPRSCLYTHILPLYTRIHTNNTDSSESNTTDNKINNEPDATTIVFIVSNNYNNLLAVGLRLALWLMRIATSNIYIYIYIYVYRER